MKFFGSCWWRYQHQLVAQEELVHRQDSPTRFTWRYVPLPTIWWEIMKGMQIDDHLFKSYLYVFKEYWCWNWREKIKPSLVINVEIEERRSTLISYVCYLLFNHLLLLCCGMVETLFVGCEIKLHSTISVNHREHQQGHFFVCGLLEKGGSRGKFKNKSRIKSRP